jgi:SAM-dependent methyltransferase
MSDPSTLSAYTAIATGYAAGKAPAKNTDQNVDYARFTALLKGDARILDLGCGPAHWAARFQRDGYYIDAVDPNPEMAAYAAATYGVSVKISKFEDFTAPLPYDGIWANFSLLHIPKSRFATALNRLHQILQPEGVLSLGMKLGACEAYDELGRFFAYYQEDELRQMLAQAGFRTLHSRCGNGHNLPDGEDTFVVLTARRNST